MKILQLNIEMDKHLEAVQQLILREDPDVLCLQEVMEENLDLFKKSFGSEINFVPTHILSDGRPMGIAILSKYPQSNIRVKYYQKPSDTMERSAAGSMIMGRPLLVSDITIGDENFTVSTTHFPVSYPGTNVSDLQKACYKSLKALLLEESELILCGDTNCPRGTEIFDDLATIMKDNIPKDAVTTIDRDLHKAGFLPYVVDCLFTTPQYRAEDVRFQSGVSDHLAVVADIKRAA